MAFDDSIPGFMKRPELEIIERVASHIQGTIVECGSFWGRSSYAWAHSSPQSQVVCINTWELQFENIREQDRPYINGDLSRILESSFETFKQNTQGLSNLSYIQGSSLGDYSIRADLIFLDSAHTFDHLVKEFEIWRPRLNKGGIVCGHDFNPYADVEVVKAIWNQIYWHDLQIFVPRASSIWFLCDNLRHMQKLGFD